MASGNPNARDLGGPNLKHVPSGREVRRGTAEADENESSKSERRPDWQGAAKSESTSSTIQDVPD